MRALTKITKTEHSLLQIYTFAGPVGSVTLHLDTGWSLHGVVPPHIVAIIVHSTIKREGWTYVDDCEFLAGKKCWCRIEPTSVDTLMEKFLQEGDNIFWETLSAIYRNHFDAEERSENVETN